MWSSISFYIAVIRLFTLTALSASNCDELRQRWPNTYDDFGVLYNGTEYPVSVYGESGSARAAAALMAALLRHVVGYSAGLVEATLDICNLTQLTNNYFEWSLAPASPNTGCKSDNSLLSFFTDFTISNIPSSLHLLAQVSFQNCIKLAKNSTFYVDANILENCNFIKNNNDETYVRDCATCFLILARNGSERDFHAGVKLQKRIAALKLPLKIEYYPKDNLFRKKILQLQNQNKTFLFLDEDIWSDIPKVFYVENHLCMESNSCSIDTPNTIRVGNGFNTEIYAPPILDLFYRFAPRNTDLRLILEYETLLKNISNIEEAACLWALKNEQYVQNWTSRVNDSRDVYKIKVFFCTDDPDENEHIQVIREVWTILKRDINDLTYNFHSYKYKCDDNENYLAANLSSIVKLNQLAGAVVWNSGLTETAVTAAENKNFILALAGQNPAHVPLDSAIAIHTTTTNLRNLTYAYVELFNRCGWTRIAIISENSTFSAKFIARLLSQKHLLYRERIVNSKNIDDVLDNFNSEDARIFFVNTNWDIANKILCSALKKGMTSAANIMWIVREWRAVNCTEEDKSSSMHHFTIGVSWRGGHTAGGSPELNSMLQKLWNTRGNILTSSAGSASFADALLLLGYGFASFLRKYPSHRFNLHDVGSAVKFSKVLDELTINGTAQQFKRNSIKSLVFVEKWKWSKGESIALWSVTPSGILNIWPNETAAATCDKLLGSQLPDRSSCSFTTGNEFAPRCQVITVIIVVILFISAIIALIVARRIRISKLRHRNEKERKRIFSSLDGYLIKRNSIRLLHTIGSGSNGLVHFAELRKSDETIAVAAKEPHEGIPILEINDFLREACLLASLSHENVIRLVGICIGDGAPMVLMEHAFYNDLKKYLILRRQFAISARLGEAATEEASEVSDSELTRFAKEAALALEYLAENRLIHRDVRAANCLVDKNRSLKLADFGMARELDCESSLYMATSRRLFPVLWMPPESLNKGIFSTASDIWALGVLILEVATLGARPYCDWSLEKVLHYVKSGGHPPLPPDTSKYTRNLVLACWQYEEKCRPSARFIHRFLKSNPKAISPALLTPDLLKRPLNYMKTNGTWDHNERSTSWTLSINNGIC